MGYDDEPANGAGNKGPAKMVLRPTTKAAVGPGSATPDTAQSSKRASAWEPGGTHSLTTSLANSRNPNQAPPGAPTGPRAGRTKSTLNMMMNANAQMPSAVAAHLNTMNINDAEPQDWNPDNRKYYDPSAGPTMSTATVPWLDSIAPSQASSSRSVRQPFNTRYCKASNFKRHDFNLGDVITVPFHTGNTNPHLSPDDQNLTLTIVGPAYSKRRMMVVLFIYMQDLYCLPLYTFGDRGLKEKPEHLKKEYVCMANVGDRLFVNQGPHSYVQAQMNHPVKPNTTVHLTGGQRVACNDDLFIGGRLTKKTYYELVDLWSTIVDTAKEEQWREDYRFVGQH
jgi:hypothetical protein